MEQTKFMVTGRAGGKTHALMEYAKKHPHPDRIAFVSHSKVESQRLRKMWMDEHDTRHEPMPRFITYTEARNGSLQGRDTEVVVDNLDILLRHLFAYPVTHATASGEMMPYSRTSENAR
jgi:hypothetical protein